MSRDLVPYSARTSLLRAEEAYRKRDEAPRPRLTVVVPAPPVHPAPLPLPPSVVIVRPADTLLWLIALAAIVAAGWFCK